MTSGVDSDALAAACYSFLEQGERELFAKSLDKACGLFGGRADIVEIEDERERGFRIDWKLKRNERKNDGTSLKEAMDTIADSLSLSSYARKMTNDALDDLAAAAEDFTTADFLDFTGRGITVNGLLMDFAAVGKFADFIGLRDKNATGSYISIGEKWSDDENGEIQVPSPLVARLLVNMRFRFGPSYGDFAGPGGIAIVRQILHAQNDQLPKAERTGVGFGRRVYGGKRLSVRIIDKTEGD